MLFPINFYSKSGILLKTLSNETLIIFIGITFGKMNTTIFITRRKR